jgi:hypothetical protein
MDAMESLAPRRWTPPVAKGVRKHLGPVCPDCKYASCRDGKCGGYPPLWKIDAILRRIFKDRQRCATEGHETPSPPFVTCPRCSAFLEDAA